MANTKRNRNTLKKQNVEDKALPILKEVFENTNRWLQFAEAKNGALIGVNGLFLFKSIDYLFEVINGKITVNIFIVGFMTAVFFTSTIISLISFLPNTSVTEETAEDISRNNNSVECGVLIFFEEINNYKNQSAYLRDIYKYYLNKNVKIKNLNKIELDYAKEILINSRITSYKYRLFKLAIRLNLIAIVVFFIFLIIA
mgnify:CR=1 FL=1